MQASKFGRGEAIPPSLLGQLGGLKTLLGHAVLKLFVMELITISAEVIIPQQKTIFQGEY